MKHIVREMTWIILAFLCAGFFLSSLLGKDENGTLLIYEDAAPLIGQIEDTETISGTAGSVGSSGGSIPAVSYSQGVQFKGTEVAFKGLFEVTTSSGTWAGDSGNGFAIYLKDIVDGSGNSRLLCMDSDSIEGMEEITADFIYDTEQDILHIHGSGVYYVRIKIYTDAGVSASYELALPVEERRGV